VADKTKEERDKDARLSVSTGQALNKMAWNPTAQKNALIIHTQVENTSFSPAKRCTIYDLIALGSRPIHFDLIQGNAFYKTAFGHKTIDGSYRDQAMYLYEKYDQPSYEATNNPLAGIPDGAWHSKKEISQNISGILSSKVQLQRAIMDWAGAAAVRFENLSDAGMADNPFATHHRDPNATADAWSTNVNAVWSLSNAIDFPYTHKDGQLERSAHTTRQDILGAGDKYQSVKNEPFQMVARVGQTINGLNFEALQNRNFDENNPTKVVTEDDLPMGGRYFKMTTQEFCEETGIDIRALSQGRLKNFDGEPPDLREIVSRVEFRYKLLNMGMVTAKDILAYNYFVINKDAAQKEFAPAVEMKELERELAAAKTDADKEAVKEKMAALRKRENRNPCSTLDTSNIDMEMSMKDLVMSEKCILASNIASLAHLKLSRDVRIKKYQKVESAHGHPAEFVNKLFMQKGWSEFTQKITNTQLSHLVPVYRFFKVYYDESECPTGELEMTFPQQTDFVAMTEDVSMRGQVGVKNITWEYISDNPATIRNDIKASVTLFFQNFNELTRERKGTLHSTNTAPKSRDWSYLDFLRRPPKDLDKLEAKKEAERAKRVKTQPPCGASTTGAGTVASKGGNVHIRANRGDSTTFEMKLVVGWAPARSSIFSSDMKDGVKNNVTPLFMTMIDHEFDIGQDGVFTLTLHYRSRIEGLLSDAKANVLATPFIREQKDKINQELAEAKVYCDSDEIKIQEKRASNIDRWARAWLADSLLGELAEGKYDTEGRTQIYSATVTRDQIWKAEWTSTKVKIDNSNCNVMRDSNQPVGMDAFSDFRRAAVGQSLGLMATPAAAGDEPYVWHQFATERGAAMSDDSNYRHYINLQMGSDTAQTTEVEEHTRERLEKDAIDNWNLNPFNPEGDDAQAGQAQRVLLTADGKIKTPGRSDIQSIDEALDLKHGGGVQRGINNDLAGDKWTIQFVYASDLFEEAAKHALDYTGVNVGNSSTSYAPCTAGKLKILLGPLTLKNPHGPGYFTVNMGDIPISVRALRKWFQRNITDQNRISFGLMPFIRSILQESLVDIFNAECFQGSMRQRVNFKTGMVSMPTKEGKSPIEASGLSWATQTWLAKGGNAANLSSFKLLDSVNANKMNLSQITIEEPLYEVDVWKRTTDMYHYIYIYAETSNPEKGWGGNYADDFKRGIYHLYMGAEEGLVKSIKFSKTDQPFLREARFEQDAYNPLSELATVYRANVKMVGNTMFHPGQYVFISMQPLGLDLGHPSTQNSHANQLGLGGYHLITNVKNEISNDNVFETELECLFDNSGDGTSRLSSGANADVEACPEESVNELDGEAGVTPPVGSP